MSVFLSVFWYTEQQVHAYKYMTRAAGADACPQGRWLYILRDGCRSAAVPRLHRGGRAPPHLQVTGWAAASHILEEGEDEERGWSLIGTAFFVSPGTPTEENWPGISSVEEFKSYNFPKYKPQPLINHAPRYRRYLLIACEDDLVWFLFLLFYLFMSFLLGLCGAWVFVTHMSVTGRKSCFSQTAMHFLPLTSLWPPTSPQAVHLTLFLSLPGWTAKASSCCFHSSKWVLPHTPPPHFYHVALFSAGSLDIIIIYMPSYLNHIKLNLNKYKWSYK